MGCRSRNEDKMEEYGEVHWNSEFEYEETYS